MKHSLFAFLAGLIFGAGLLLSGMANPEKVIGFLDLAGDWDPSLALVMVGAIGTAFIPFQMARKRSRSFLGSPMSLPTSRKLDKSLLIGALLFGAGWGIAGFCPGPGLVALGAGETSALIFVSAMLAGMLAHHFSQRSSSR